MQFLKRTLAGWAAMSALVGPMAEADTISWVSISARGFYTHATNWSPATVPGAGSDVVFNLNSNYGVVFNIHPTNRTALIDAGTVRFNLGGNGYTIAGTTAQEDLVVGKNNTVALSVFDGTLTAPVIRVGSGIGSNGTLNVAKNITYLNTYLNALNFIEIGGSGTGTLNVADGGHVLAGDVLIGGNPGGTGTLNVTGGGVVASVNGVLGATSGSSGTVTVTDVGSLWTNSGDLSVGSSAGGTGVLNVASGGGVTVGGLLRIWNTGTANLNGGTLDVGSLTNSGTFDFNSGTLDIDNLTFGAGELLGSVFTIDAGKTLVVDNAATIASGSNLTLDGGTLDVGSLTNSGTFDFNSGTLDIDNLTFGPGELLGSVFTIDAGKTLVVDNAATIASGSNLTLDGGTLDVGSLTSSGTFNFNSGTLDIDNLTFGAGGPLGSIFTIDASKTLVVRNSTAIDAGGSLTVDGAGAILTSNGDLQVGVSDAGALTIQNGGLVVTSNVGYIGLGDTGSGTATVTGLGSAWTAGGLAIGLLGDGQLDVTQGAEVSVGGLALVAGAGSSTGSLSLTNTGAGTSRFNAYSLVVGGDDSNAGGTGSVAVGAGSEIIVGDLLRVYDAGTVDLNGGTLQATTVENRGTFNLNSGTLWAETIENLGNFNFNSGQLNLTGSDLTIGTGGLLGNNVSLDANRQVSVSGNTIVEAGATLSLIGGALVVGDTLAIQADGTISGEGVVSSYSVVVDGNLNLSGNTDILSSIVAIGDVIGGGGTGQISIADGTTTQFHGDVYASGSGITVGAGGEAIYSGRLGGCSGTLGGTGTHTALGTVAPGCSPGLLTVENDFVFENTATFLLEISGLTPGTDPGYDVMEIGGDAWLDGTLDVTLLDGFTPMAGDSFDVLLAEVLHGTFGNSVLPDLSPELVWNIQYLLNPIGTDTLRLTAQATVPIPPAVLLFGSALGLMGVMRRKISS